MKSHRSSNESRLRFRDDITLAETSAFNSISPNSEVDSHKFSFPTSQGSMQGRTKGKEGRDGSTAKNDGVQRGFNGARSPA